MESTYCTVSEVNTYARANGEREWLQAASIDLTGAINNAAGYAVGSRSMSVDGFQDSINPISAGDKFTIANDSTATTYTVIGAVYNAGTVEITFYPTLAESASDNDAITFTTSTSTDEQTRCVVKATKDIVRYHKQLNQDGSLWLPTNADLNKAAILQSIHLLKVMDMRDRAKVIGELTRTSFDDGEIVIQNISNPTLDEDAKYLIDKVRGEYREEIRMNDEFYDRTGAYYGR